MLDLLHQQAIEYAELETFAKAILIFLSSGCSTEGEIESVLFVGPMAPATYLLTPVVLVTSVAARRAIFADSKLSLYA